MIESISWYTILITHGLGILAFLVLGPPFRALIPILMVHPVVRWTTGYTLHPYLILPMLWGAALVNKAYAKIGSTRKHHS